MSSSSMKMHPSSHGSDPKMLRHGSLLVDEIDITKTTTSSNPSLIKGFVDVDCADSPKGLVDPLVSKNRNTVACPCCQRYVACGSINDGCGNIHLRHLKNSDLAVSLSDAEIEKDTDEETESGLPLFGSLNTSIDYQIKEELHSGWLHKKGTGRDWLSSVAWKSRWASLVLADVPEYGADVPLLLLYWHSQVPTPTTVIILDSTIIMAVDRVIDRPNGEEKGENDEMWGTRCFDVVHTRAPSDKQKEDTITRTFAVPLKERNEWVFVIRKALQEYGKRRVLIQRKKALTATTSAKPQNGERSITGGSRVVGMPPLSPPRRGISDTGGRATGLPPISPPRTKRSTAPLRGRTVSPEPHQLTNPPSPPRMMRVL